MYIWGNIELSNAKNTISKCVYCPMLNRTIVDILASALLNLFNLLQKSDKMFDKPCILSLFSNTFDKFYKT